MKFRKKPIEIEAIQFNGDNAGGVSLWCAERLGIGQVDMLIFSAHHFLIRTLEGDMVASPGDWIICGVKGEIYPCKPDVFEASYEAVQ